jgi:protein-S-isoprenylcysteine O-methyltransferase Ste14
VARTPKPALPGPSLEPDPAPATRWRPPPALVLLVPFALALGVSRLVPWPIGAESIVRPVGFAIVLAAFGLMSLATREMDEAATTKVAWREGAKLVTTGPFAWTRHPAYLAFVAWCLGAALVIGTWWPIAILPLALVAFHVLVIGPEEAYLAARFGPEYAAYRARVRRWL